MPTNVHAKRRVDKLTRRTYIKYPLSTCSPVPLSLTTIRASRIFVIRGAIYEKNLEKKSNPCIYLHHAAKYKGISFD